MGRWTGRHGKQDGRMQRDKTESWWGDGEGDMENKMEGCNETRLRAGGEMDRATWKTRWKDATRQD